jgi:hypothetical protein
MSFQILYPIVYKIAQKRVQIQLLVAGFADKVACGHDVMIDAPDWLTEILLEIAQ